MAQRVTVRRRMPALATLGLGSRPSVYAETEEPRTGPMGASDHAGDGGERAIALILVKEAVVQHEDGMRLAAPLAHESSPGLLPGIGVEPDFALLRHGSCKGLESAPSRLGQAAIGLLLDLVSDCAPQEIAAQ